MPQTTASIVDSAEKTVRALKESQFRLFVSILAVLLFVPLILNYVKVFKGNSSMWEPAIHTVTYITALIGLLPSTILRFSVRKVFLLAGMITTASIAVFIAGGEGSGYIIYIFAAIIADSFFEPKKARKIIVGILGILTAITASTIWISIDQTSATSITQHSILLIITKLFLTSGAIVGIHYLGTSGAEKLKSSIMAEMASVTRLNQEQQTTTDLLESIPGLFFLYDSNWELKRWNNNVVEVSGYSDEELRDKDILSFFEQQQHFSIRKTISDTFLQGQAYLEAELLKKDNTHVPIALLGKMIEIDNKSYCCAIATDLTEKRLLEKEVQESQKMEVLGILAGGVAHDLNNILGAIIGYTDIALSQVDDGEMPKREHLSTILDSCDRAAGIVRQILMFSRRTETKRIQLELHTVVRDTVKLIRQTIPKSITIEESLSHDGHSIWADINQVHQVVMNVCTNAWHAMREQGGVLSIGTETKTVSSKDIPKKYPAIPGAFQCITIKDTGKGIPSALIEKIFDPFYTTKPTGEGTGLGLAVVDKIIRSHGGFLTVESVAQTGTTFSIYFPIDDQNAFLRKQPNTPDLPAGTESILVVDDEPQIRDATSIILSRLGYTVLTAENGRKGLELFLSAKDEISLVITDFAMPHKNGLELAHDIFAVNPHIPVMLCTGYSEAMESKDIDQTPFTAVIPKPIRKEKLATTVRKLLDGEKNYPHE